MQIWPENVTLALPVRAGHHGHVHDGHHAPRPAARGRRSRDRGLPPTDGAKRRGVAGAQGKDGWMDV